MTQAGKRSTRRVDVIAALALAATAVACGGSPQSTATDAGNDRLSAIASSIERDFNATADAFARQLGLGPAESTATEPANRASTEATPPAPRARRRAPQPAPAPAAPPAEVIPSPEPEVTVDEPPSEVADQIEAPAVYEPPAIVDHSIYTAADLDVLRPSLRPSQLPWQWPRDVARTDTLEVLVSQQGDVERIKLISQPRRMVDMMALSAAKMWKFDPALKDGSPVRYRLVLTAGSAMYQR